MNPQLMNLGMAIPHVRAPQAPLFDLQGALQGAGPLSPLGGGPGWMEKVMAFMQRPEVAQLGTSLLESQSQRPEQAPLAAPQVPGLQWSPQAGGMHQPMRISSGVRGLLGGGR